MSEGPDLDDLPHAARLWRAAARDGRAVYGRVDLRYADRSLRRRRLETAAGEGFLVQLGETLSLDPGDAFELADGRLIAVEAAPEPVFVATGCDLAVLAWHLGGHHVPCQIGRERILVPADPGLGALLQGLGAVVSEGVEPFLPIAGAAELAAAHGHDHGRVTLAAQTATQAPVAYERPTSGPFDD